MIADLKPYPEYRDAKPEWLGEIPAHWAVRRMKYVVRETDSRSTSGKEQLLRISQFTGVTQRHRADGSADPDTRADSLLGYKRVEPNDLVINIMLAWNGSMGVSRYSGIASPAYCVYRFGHGLNPWYFHNLLRSSDYKAKIKVSSTGVVESRLRLYSDDLGRIEALIPPLEEQAAIVQFLGWANARLDRAIGAKRRVISLLTEQKRAIIHRAVTRGLDPSASHVPSGIPWLGKIPKHWKVIKLKHLSPQITVGIVIQPARLYALKGVPALRSLNISSGSITTEQMVYISEEGHLANLKSRLNCGDVVVVRTGRTGVAAVVPPSFDGANCIDLLIVRSAPRLLSEYLLLYFRSHGATTDIAFNSVGAIQAHYNTSTLANLRIPLPPIDEQRIILDACHDALAPIANTISRLEREIELLCEYRTRLVAEVVTGKLDVREAAARLPAGAGPEVAGDETSQSSDPELEYEAEAE